MYFLSLLKSYSASWKCMAPCRVPLSCNCHKPSYFEYYLLVINLCSLDVRCRTNVSIIPKLNRIAFAHILESSAASMLPRVVNKRYRSDSSGATNHHHTLPTTPMIGETLPVTYCTRQIHLRIYEHCQNFVQSADLVNCASNAVAMFFLKFWPNRIRLSRQQVSSYSNC